MQIDNYVLTIGGFTQDLPRLATPATVTAWSVPVEYQASGYFVAVTAAGQPPAYPACNSNDAMLIGSVELAADPAAILAQAKTERLATINESCDTALAMITATYPAGEISSWPQQVAEAQAVAADPAVAAPLLTALGTARGVDIIELSGRVLAKAAAFSVASGQIIGRRQALEDALTAATTPEAVAEVAW